MAGRQAELRRVSEHDKAIWQEEIRRRAKHIAEISRDDSGRRTREYEEYERCASDKLYWLSNYGWMGNPKADEPLLRRYPFVPWPKQQALVAWAEERLQRREVGLIPKSREIGVTWLFLHFVIHEWLFSHDFSALLGSRKQDLVDKKDDADSLFERMRFVLGRQPSYIVGPREVKGELVPPSSWIVDKSLGLVNLANRNEVAGEATNRHFGRGKRRTLVIIDEFAAVRPDVAAATWRALDSVAKTIFLIYNPGSKGHLSYELHKGKTRVSENQVFELDWRADPRRSERFKEDRIRPNGTLSEAEFAQEYEVTYGATDRTGRIYDANRHLHAYGDDDLPEEARAKMPLYGAWDFGSGPSLLCWIGSVYDYANDTIYVDSELTWSQTHWANAAADVNQKRGEYGNRNIDFGDPAGVQRDSAQASWETNLRAAGVPVYCLESVMNTRENIEWGFKLAQERLDTGRLFIHRRCRQLWRSLESWARNVPEGVSIDYAEKAYIGPKHDMFSHHGMAFCYLMLGYALVLGNRHQAPIVRATERAVKVVRKRSEKNPRPSLREPNLVASKIARAVSGARAAQHPAGMPGTGQNNRLGSVFQRMRSRRS